MKIKVLEVQIRGELDHVISRKGELLLTPRTIFMDVSTNKVLVLATLIKRPLTPLG